MRHKLNPARCATIALIGAVALLPTPGFAQDVPAQTTPAPAPAPTVVAPPEQPALVIPPVVETAPQTVTTETTTTRTTPRATTRTTTTRTATRATPPARVATPARVPTPVREPVPVRDTAPAADTTPVQPAAAPAPAPVVQPPADTTTTEASTTTTQPDNGAPTWMWLAGLGVAALLIIGFFALRRRSTIEDYDDYTGYEQATYAEPAPVAADYVAPAEKPPVAAPIVTPVPAVAAAVDAAPEIAVPSEAALHEPDKADLAAVTEATPPVEHRPWLEFAFRPVRAGTNAKQALVELELTVGNAGDMRAEDVRVSTFMIPQGSSTEMERLLVNPPAGAQLDPITLEAGEGTQIDTTLSMDKQGLTAESFAPVVVADARYKLADGREGRTSAAFLIGVGDEDGTLHPIALDRPRMHHDVEARLHGNLERA